MNGAAAAAGRASAGSGKRVRDSSEQKSPDNKKQKMYNPDEGRLAGHYNDRMPKDAQPIGVPGTNDRMNKEPSAEAKKSQTNPGRSKPGAGFTHRTQNNIHAPLVGRAGKSYPSFKPPMAKSTAPPKATRNMARGTALNEEIGDGFSDSPSKRRKTNGAPKTSNQEHPVEVLSDDDDDIVVNTVHAVNGRPVSSNSTSAPIEIDSQSQSQSDYFAAREQRSVNQHIVSGPQNKRRQKSSAQNTPSVSSFAPNEHRGTAHSPSGTHTGTSGYEDLAKPYLPERMKSRTKVRAAENDKLPHPSTTLGEGVDDDFGVEGMQRRKDDHALSRVNGGLSHISRPSVREVLERNANKAAEQETPRQPRQTRMPSSAEREQSLRAKFKRDTETMAQQQANHQQPRHHSAVSNMQVISNGGKANTVQDSPDQLQGGNTVIHRGQMHQGPSRMVAESPTHRRSPSDIVPTNFKRSTKKPARTTQPVQTARDNSEVRVPLKAIFCRGCVLDTRAMNDTASIDLVYQMAHASFLVELNGQPYCIPGLKEHMTIGKHEASAWHEGKHSTQVVLKGSASDRSNGTILLSFVDEEGMSDCYDWLGVATADFMATKKEGKERIEKMFHNQTAPVQVDADKHAQQARSKRMADNVQSQHELARRKKQPATDDEIVYEQSDEGEKRQTSVRSRMQDSAEQGSSQLQPSPYFTGDSTRVSRKSTRQSKPVIERTPTPPPAPPRWTETHELEPWHQPVMYPTTGARRIAVDFQDIERLDEGEFLNDNLVGFALRRIEEGMAPEHKSKVHFFNSYFFTSLTSKNGRKAFNYDAVKKWTKQKDLFDIPYIVVPINENLHWFVAIICNLPNLARKTALLGDEAADIAETPTTSQRSSVQPSPIRDPSEEVPDSQDPEKPDEQAMRQLSLGESGKGTGTGGEIYEFDENKNLVGVVSEAHRDGAQKNGKKSKKRAAPSLRKYPTDKPTIITLDSFAVGHPGQVSTLKKYVEAEALDKRGMDASAAGIQGMTATGIPVQSNYCDCGLYLVGYVAEFAKDPEGFVNKILTRQLDQESDFASFDPSEKRAELRDDLLKLHEEQDQARIAAKKAKKEEKLNKVATTAVTGDPSATPAASKHPSPVPAPPRPSTKPVTKAPSPHETLPTASRIPSDEELGHLLGTQHDSHESRPDPTVNAMESSIRGTRESGDASDDGDMDEGPPVPFLSDGATRHSATHAQKAAPKQTASFAGSSAEDGDDGEMLDGLVDGTADAKEEKKMRDFAQRRNGHKVVSPEVDGLVNVLSQSQSQEPPSAKKES